MRARLGTTAHFCKVVGLKLTRTQVLIATLAASKTTSKEINDQVPPTQNPTQSL